MKSFKMKVLIVANYNPGQFSPFVVEQVESLKRFGVEFDFFGIVGKGPLGYLKNLPALKRKINQYKPDLIHAHYGLSGLLATLQNKIPVVVTYHGSDIHSGGLILKLSKLAMHRATHNIIVANHLKKMVGDVKNASIIPCGVDDETFQPLNKDDARHDLRWKNEKRYIVFAGAFDRDVKNPQLARDVVAKIPNCQLVELKGYNRHQVNFILNAADCLLMTSHNEGSPQIIKEAMCCGTPIVSVNVGDVADVCDGVDGCYVCERDANQLANAVNEATRYQGKTNGNQHIHAKRLSLEEVAERINDIYQLALRR